VYLDLLSAEDAEAVLEGGADLGEVIALADEGVLDGLDVLGDHVHLGLWIL